MLSSRRSLARTSNSSAQLKLSCGAATVAAIVSEQFNAFFGCCSTHAYAHNRVRAPLGNHLCVSASAAVAVCLCILLGYSTRKSTNSDCTSKSEMGLFSRRPSARGTPDRRTEVMCRRHSMLMHALPTYRYTTGNSLFLAHW